MFDLTTEPWLPVVTDRGVVRDVSLGELFRDAPSLMRLGIAFAPEQMAVTRFLVAVLQSAQRGPNGKVQRADWIDNPASLQASVADYLTRWRHRFDLFDAERPFMQATVEAGTPQASIAALVLDWSAGNNVTLFDHHVDARPPAITPAQAARALLTTLLYQPGGGVSKPFNRTDSPGSKGLMVLVEGETLWESLAANTPTLDPDTDFGGGKPSWERDAAEAHRPNAAGTTPEGWLDRATWQSRAVRLQQDDDGLVRTCQIHQHLKLGDGALGDPFIPLKSDRKTGEVKIVRLQPNRRLWRSADVVLRGLSDQSRASHGRTVVADALESFDQLGEDRHPQVLVVGLQIDQAKVGDAQSARLPVSRALLEDEDRLDLISRAVEQADAGAKAVGLGIGQYLDVLGLERDNKRYDHWRQSYWAELGRQFSRFVDDVAHADEVPSPVGPQAEAWTRTVRNAATHAVQRFAAMNTQAFAHDQAVARSQHRFIRALEEDQLLAVHTTNLESA